MILNLHFDKFDNNNFLFDGTQPLVMLERNQNYIIGLRLLHIELETSNQVTKDNELWSLSTNLVDRSSANSYQAISYFTMTRGKWNQVHTPTSVVYHPLETHELQNPRIIIQRITSNNILSIKKVFVQLEIKKCGESASHCVF